MRHHQSQVLLRSNMRAFLVQTKQPQQSSQPPYQKGAVVMAKKVTFSTTPSSDDKSGEYIKTMEKMEEWNEILDSDKPVVIQCSTTWCRPCQVLKPTMQKAVGALEGKVKFYYIDVEKFTEIGEMLQVSSVPNVFALKGGQIVDEFSGVVNDKRIAEMLEKAQA